MDSLHFDSGKMVEGVILFSGLKPIPETYGHGQSVPFTLDLMDQDENEIRRDGKLFVDRTWRLKSKFDVRENSLHAHQFPSTNELEIRQTLHAGRVSEPDPKLLEKHRRARQQAEN